MMRRVAMAAVDRIFSSATTRAAITRTRTGRVKAACHSKAQKSHERQNCECLDFFHSK